MKSDVTMTSGEGKQVVVSQGQKTPTKTHISCSADTSKRRIRTQGNYFYFTPQQINMFYACIFQVNQVCGSFCVNMYEYL